MESQEIRSEAIKILARAGYAVKYGGDGWLHIVPKSGSKWGTPARGQRALCGAAASRNDYHNEYEPCQECLHKILVPGDSENGLVLVPAWEQK